MLCVLLCILYGDYLFGICKLFLACISWKKKHVLFTLYVTDESNPSIHCDPHFHERLGCNRCVVVSMCNVYEILHVVTSFTYISCENSSSVRNISLFQIWNQSCFPLVFSIWYLELHYIFLFKWISRLKHTI